MKPFHTILGLVAIAAAAKFTLFPCDGDCFFGGTANAASALSTLAPTGEYLEARNVTVYGGHCHLNSEYDHQGDSALVAWSFDGGVHDGVDLGGVRVVAALAADLNLDESTPRTSELWIDAPSARAGAAAEDWLRTNHKSELGHLIAVHAAHVAHEREGDGFAVYIDGVVSIEGDALADRSCCTMPAQRGYEPLMAEAGAVVGNAARCVFEGSVALTGWTYEGANSVFVTRFGTTDEALCESECCPSSRVDCAPATSGPKP